jgi:hypothetical protein
MNLYILSIILASLLIIPGSFTFGEKLSTSTTDDDAPEVYIFVQIFHRNSDGKLLGYIVSDKFTDFDPVMVSKYMDALGTVNEFPVYQVGEYTIEVFGEKYLHHQETVDITASSLFVVQISANDHGIEPQSKLAARFAHDGLLLFPGDTTLTVWNFIRVI